jgi:hypothetical protein
MVLARFLGVLQAAAIASRVPHSNRRRQEHGRTGDHKKNKRNKRNKRSGDQEIKRAGRAVSLLPLVLLISWSLGLL